MKIRELLTENDDWDNEEEPETEPDQETIKPLMVQLRTVYALVKKYKDYQNKPDVKEILNDNPIIFRNTKTKEIRSAVIRIEDMADFMHIYNMLIPHMREKMQADASESPEEFHRVLNYLREQVNKRR